MGSDTVQDLQGSVQACKTHNFFYMELEGETFHLQNNKKKISEIMRGFFRYD